MKSILVVDDEHDIALAIEILLEGEGFKVIIARNGREALARLAESRPDLVLLDLMMPVMNGRETLKAIREDPEYRSLPVILMSAVRAPGDEKDKLWDAFLTKPFDIDRLVELIGKVLSGRPSGRPAP